MCDFYNVIDLYMKYTWVIPLKDKKGITITKAFQKILDESNCKPNEIWVVKGSKLYNKSELQKTFTGMYSPYSDWKSVGAERFVVTIKNKIYNYMTSTSKHFDLDKLDNIINKYNCTFYGTIKMKHVDVNRNICIYWLW